MEIYQGNSSRKYGNLQEKCAEQEWEKFFEKLQDNSIKFFGINPPWNNLYRSLAKKSWKKLLETFPGKPMREIFEKLWENFVKNPGTSAENGKF